MSKETGGPAFQQIHRLKEEASLNLRSFKVEHLDGMTLWDHWYGTIAGALIEKIWIAEARNIIAMEPLPKEIAEKAADIVDAMIAERKKRFEAHND